MNMTTEKLERILAKSKPITGEMVLISQRIYGDIKNGTREQAFFKDEFGETEEKREKHVKWLEKNGFKVYYDGYIFYNVMWT